MKDILKVLSDLGITLSAKTLVVIGVAFPVLLAALVWLYGYVQKRRKLAAAAGPDVQKGGPAPEPEIDPDGLRKAWKKFMGRLPATHRRSILNFEHFVVLDLAASGKSELREQQTDWLYQTEQVARKVEPDPELPVYLAASAVIMEIPARYLTDSSEACRKALDHLWRPIYRRRSPTVVVALDADWLVTRPQVDVVDLARHARMKVNQLAALRGKAIEVRVALTRLGSVTGFDEAAAFWASQGMSNRIPLPAKGPVRPALDAWDQEARAQLPRALSALASPQLHRYVEFLRKSRGLVAPLDAFLDALFMTDSMSPDPERGGVYLTSRATGSASPLRNAKETGKGPDPSRNHLIAVAFAASAVVTYMGVAFEAQRSVWLPAASAIASYDVSPTLAGQEREAYQRKVIDELTLRHTGPLYRFPDFFGGEREEIRGKLSRKIRDKLLVPQLHIVAEKGIENKDTGMTLKWRRAVYMLALIHSYQADKLGIKEKLDLWQKMTLLPADVIADYIDNTTSPDRDPVSFTLGYTEADARDTEVYWSTLPRAVTRSMADGVLSPRELTDMQGIAREMRGILSRFESDPDTLRILDNINRAADVDDERDPEQKPRLREEYMPRFEPYVGQKDLLHLGDQRATLGRLVEKVLAAKIDQEQVPMLHQLVDRLATLVVPSTPAEEEAIRLDLAGETFEVQPRAWATVLRDSRGTQLVDGFRAYPGRDSIFFSPEIEAGLRSVVWNPLGTEGSIFSGRGTFAGRYTRPAYERHVRGQIRRLAKMMSQTLHLDDGTAKALVDLVRSEVARYGTLYHAEATRFVAGYRLDAPTAEALRVALGQISSPRSTFDDFVNAVDENTHLSLDDEDDGGEPKKGDKKDKKGSGSSGSDKKDSGTDKKDSGSDKKDSGSDKKDSGSDKKDAEPEDDGEESVRRMLEPLSLALADFGPWHDAVGADKGAPELIKYKEIARQLLADLTASSQPAAADKADATAAPTLEKELSPAGRAVLASAQKQKGSYDEMVRKWISDAGLPVDQQAPFLAPFAQLERIGQSDIEVVVARVWNTEMWPPVNEIYQKFPFNRTADRTVLPEELTALFNPTDGKFFVLFRAYIDPLSSVATGQPFRQLASLRGRVKMPADLYPTVNAAAALSAHLWDGKGVPKRIEVKVATVPFDTVPNARITPTVVYLNVGDTSVYNFNQKPGALTIPIDWTKDESAQIGVQVTDVETKETSFPSPQVASGPYFRFYRLLQSAAKVSPVKQPADSLLHEWVLLLRDGGGGDRTRARVVVVGDPWQIFTVPRASATTRAAR